MKKEREWERERERERKREREKEIGKGRCKVRYIERKIARQRDKNGKIQG